MKSLLARIRNNGLLLELVNGELKMFGDGSAIDPELLREIRERKKDLVEFLKENSQNTAADLQVNIPLVPVQADYSLSSSQRRLWVMSQFEEANVAYNMPAVYVFEGNLNQEALAFAFNTLIERHESLRTVFKENTLGEVRQVVVPLEQTGFAIEYTDLREHPERDEAVRTFVHKELVRPFDLAHGPMVRAGLLQVTDNTWIFIYAMHHIVSDGWSMTVLISELMQLYNAHCEGRPSPLQPLRIQYKDYAAWQKAQLSGAALETHRGYWLDQFSGELPLLEFPADYPRPLVKSYNGGAVHQRINAVASKAIKALCQEKGSTLFMGLLAAVNAILYRYTGQEDIVTGTQIAGREHADLDNQIGFYLNTLALRTRFKGSDSFDALLGNVKSLTLGAYAHQVFPFDELVNALPVQRDRSRTPLFDVSVVLHNTDSVGGGEALGPDALRISLYPDQESRNSLYELAFDLREIGEEIHCMIVYNSDVYARESIQRLATHFEALLGAAATAPQTPVNQLKFITAEEERQLAYGFNQQSVLDYPSGTSIAEVFAEQVSKTPDATALVFENTSLTYRQLHDKSDALAAYLLSNHAIQPGDTIGIMLDRSEQLIIAILGILKSGAAYVPFDTDYPPARKTFMVEDTNIKALITSTDYMFEVDYYTGPLIALDVQLDEMAPPTQPLKVVVQPNDLAYVMYTSGTTGNPKGVLVEHRNVVRLVKPGRYAGLTGTETILSTGAVSFDATTFEYWAALLNGGKLVMCRKETLLDEQRLATAIKEYGADTMWFTAGWLNQLVDKDIELFSGLKTLMAGGDKLSPVHIQALRQRYPDLHIINGYGPTENTTFSITFTIDTIDEGASLPIGKPIDNSTAYILDEDGQLVPLGVVGEICVGGAGLSRGYLNQPELTAEKFVANPFITGERIYKTGDLGRWLPDGNIAFVGRRDAQVKVRGYRIELGEIEAALQANPDITAAAVIARETSDGEKELVAYIVSATPQSSATLGSFLSDSLPPYMLPSHYIQLAALPLTGNGKVDKKRLPDTEGAGVATGVDYIAPRNITEEKLVSIWKGILGHEKIGVKDDFFNLGGHSLKATRLASQIHKEFDVRVDLKDLFSRTILEEQAQFIDNAGKESFEAIGVAPVMSSYPLSSSQRRLWVLSQFEEGNVAYNMPAAYIFSGELKKTALDKAFFRLIERHESLRTIFKEDETGEVKQFILEPAASRFAIDYQDLQELTAGDRDEKIKALIQQNFTQPFDLENGPLIRAGLYQVASGQWLFAYTMHHIISDGWSMGILINELLQFYNAYRRAEANPFSPLRIQYKDYAVWQQQQLSGTALEAHKAYWMKQFEGDLPVLDIPADYPRPAVKTYNGAALTHRINNTTSQLIKEIAQEQGGTLFMALLAAVKTLLYRYSNQEDIIVGSPIAGRPHSDLHDQIGFYINTLTLRTRFSGNDTYRQLLDNVKALTLGAYEHQVYPFDELVNNLSLQRDMSRSALFDVMVILQNNEMHERGAAIQPEGLEISMFGGAEMPMSKFDLLFSFVEAGGGIEMAIEYNTDIYAAETIGRMINHFNILLQAIADQPDTPLIEYEYVIGDERRHILHGFNDNASPYDITYTLPTYVEKQVARTPDNIAISIGDRTITYRSLNEQANQLANYIREKHDVKPDDLVSVLLERDEWLVIALLGVLKSGAAYVPVDPAYPQERIDYILNDSKSKFLIDEEWMKNFRNEQAKYDTGDLLPQHFPDNIAYIIYTSGSTGNPKGVMIEHRNVSAFLHWCPAGFSPELFDVMFAVTSVCFDISIFELFYTLSTGKRIRLLDNALAIPEYLEKEKDQRILLNTVPSVIGNLIKEGQDFSSVTIMNLAGEAVPAQYIEALDTERMEVNNLYGPSEDTTYSTIFRFRKHLPVLVGKAIANSRVYILNEKDQIQPVGVIGEICIAGDGISRGYLGKPELTKEKYIEDPFAYNERMYRTGDLGRWLPDGNIDCLGRKDAQVKVRGYRIELGEIETCLMKHEAIEDAVAMVRTTSGGDKELVAYVITSKEMSTTDLRNYVGSQLPAFMIPGYFVALKELPRTLNGKVDRKLLPDPEGISIASGIEYIAPRNTTEEKLVDIWQQVLGREKIGVKDNFFALGGHSLKATHLVTKIHQAFEVKLGLKDLFAATVLEDQARIIADSRKESFVSIIPAPVQPDYVMSSAQRRLWVLSQFEGGSKAYNMPGIYVFEGQFNLDALERSFITMIERHEVLRTVFKENDKGDVRQFILAPEAIAFRIQDHDLRNETDKPALVKAAVQAEMVKPFDLAAGPLVRADIYQLSDNEWVFTYTMHHIISDGWSMEILIAELMQLYHAYTHQQPNPLRPLRIQYKDYANWQQEQLKEGAVNEHKAYWLEQLGGEIPILDLPGDRPRPIIKTYNGSVVGDKLNSQHGESLKQLSREQGCTLFMGIVTLVNTLLHRYTGQDDLIVGSPIAGREHGDLQDQIGFYVNTLALRSRFKGSDSFRDLLTNVRQLTLDAYEHQSYPFDELVDSLKLNPDMGRTPLFDVMVVLQTDAAPEGEAIPQPGELGISTYGEGEHTTSKFDMTFFFQEVNGEFYIRIEYNVDIYNRSTIQQMVAHLHNLLGAIVSTPDEAINKLPLLTGAEKQLLLHDYNQTEMPFPGDTKSAVELFEEMVAQGPERAAVVVSEEGVLALTYGELNGFANGFAAYLRQHYDVSTGHVVGIEMDRSANFLIAVIGVMKAGAAYLPIDPTYPLDRIEYIVADSQCKVLVTEAVLDAFLAEKENYPVDNPPPAAGPHDLAYAIYTSGSTGLPKGSLLEHRSLVNLCHWYINRYNINSESRSTLFSSVSFDASVSEIFTNLLAGAVLYVVPDIIRADINALATFYAHHGLTICFLPTAMGEKLIGLETNNALRTLVLGGDKLNTYADRGYDIFNNYGPTECTIMVTSFHVTGYHTNIPIGKPINNTRAYILNEALQLQPPGFIGELCFAGAGLARGYLNRPELTAEKFVEAPFLSGERIYRTGDLGRWLPDGNIEFVGRRDTQVKIRGFRIEIGEIETQLQQHPDVESSVVVAYTNREREKELVAYLVSKATLHIADMRAYLGRTLPAYMIPAYFVQLPEMPLSPNGKVEKHRLPDPLGGAMDTGAEYVAPRNETEATLTRIWQEVLGREKVGIDDNFFDLGGNSIKIVKMVGLVNTALNIKISVVTAFKFPNISTLSEHLHADAPAEARTSDEEMQSSVNIMDETINVLNNLNNEE